MEDGQANDPLNAEEVRGARFPQSRRGYDRDTVDAFLERVADWVEGATGQAKQVGRPLTSEFAKVGERTADILTAAEEAAGNLRREAKEYSERLRTKTDEEARAARLNASQKADELIAAAESKAEQMIEQAVARRRRLNQAIASLIERREEIASEAQRLADQLLEAVEALQADEQIDEAGEPLEDEPDAGPGDGGRDDAGRSGLGRGGPELEEAATAGEPTELEAPDQRRTAFHRPGR